jgi:TRAP-type C4-dicarboxylate transport system permease small subunit
MRNSGERLAKQTDIRSIAPSSGDGAAWRRQLSILSAVSSRLSRWALYIASICLAALGIVVVYGVVQRYVFNHAPPSVEQVALLLVISVAMFGAAAGVHDAGHIGLDSIAKLLPLKVQRWLSIAVHLLTLVFAAMLLFGSLHMAVSTGHDTIPTLGISEASRYLPAIVAAVLILLFSTEHIVVLLTQRRPETTWH